MEKLLSILLLLLSVNSFSQKKDLEKSKSGTAIFGVASGRLTLQRNVVEADPLDKFKTDLVWHPWTDVKGFGPMAIFDATGCYALGDTLYVPPGKYNFIKVGGKVYEVLTTISEIKSNPVGLTIWSPPHSDYKF